MIGLCNYSDNCWFSELIPILLWLEGFLKILKIDKPGKQDCFDIDHNLDF